MLCKFVCYTGDICNNHLPLTSSPNIFDKCHQLSKGVNISICYVLEESTIYRQLRPLMGLPQATWPRKLADDLDSHGLLVLVLDTVRVCYSASSGWLTALLDCVQAAYITLQVCVGGGRGKTSKGWEM